MNGITKKIVCWVLFFFCLLLVWLIYSSIMEPVTFNKQKAVREAEAIQRLKDIRTLQVAFKGANGRFASTVDSLKTFYNEGKMKIVMQVGSADDSLSWAHTQAVCKGKKYTGAQLYEMYKAGDTLLVFSLEQLIPVKDTVFASREDFCVDSIATIPFSGGQLVEMESVVKMVSGVPVPLFEARMPYKALLKGLDNQLRINLDDERRTAGKFEGLQVGSVSAPNNNAGNWE